MYSGPGRVDPLRRLRFPHPNETFRLFSPGDALHVSIFNRIISWQGWESELSSVAKNLKQKSGPRARRVLPRYLWYFRRYKRRGTKVRSPRSARSTAPWERRRRLTPILQINFEVSGKHFTSRYYFKKFRNFWAIRSWKLGGKNTFLGARGQGGHRRGSTPMSGELGRVRTKLFFPRS